MKIIDKNTDFYDYIQDIYQDTSVSFDRTDSFVVTKDIVCNALAYHPSLNCNFVLLQVCNTFWLFVVKITKTDSEYYYLKPKDYEVLFMHKWQCYDKPSELIKLSVVSFTIHKIINQFCSYCKTPRPHYILDESKILKHIDTLVAMINTNDYKEDHVINRYVSYKGSNFNEPIEKHIPLLKASGLCEYIDPQDIYFAIEEYLLHQIQASERSESVGLTNKEKIINHGFDTIKSFRGKQQTHI